MSDYAQKTRDLQEKELIIRNQQSALDRQNRLIVELQSQNASAAAAQRAQSGSVLRGHKDIMSLVGSMNNNNMNNNGNSSGSSSSSGGNGNVNSGMMPTGTIGMMADKNFQNTMGTMGAMGGMGAMPNRMSGIGYDPRMSIAPNSQFGNGNGGGNQNGSGKENVRP
jgi:hypothetical protein